MKIDFLHPEMTLMDGHPFAHIETSIPVELSHLREPIGLSYAVQVGSQSYALGDVQAGLLNLQALMIYVQEGYFPADRDASTASQA